MPRPRPLDPTAEMDLPAWQRGGRAPGSQGELTAWVETQRLDGMVGHGRTRGGGGPALQPVRALAAGLQSPEGHTEPGPAPGQPVTSAVNPSRPDAQPHPGPSSSTGYQVPGHGHSRERGRQLGGGWGGSCSEVQVGVWEHLHWDRGMERQSQGGDHKGWRQVSGEKWRKTPYIWGRTRGGEGRPAGDHPLPGSDVSASG